jgi:hypothetical protein
MGDSALGKIQTIDDKVSASATDNTPDFLDGKVDGTTITVNGSNKLQREALTGDVTTVGNAATVVGGDADTVVTNANLTGGVTSVGNAATVVTNANLTGVVTSTGNATAIADEALALSKLARGTSGDILTANGAGSSPTYQTPAAGGGIVQNIQTFTSSGTWTKPAGVSTVWVKVWGGGGGGGGNGGGAGGSGGGHAEGLIAVTGNVTVTVGAEGVRTAGTTFGTAGGTSSFPGSTTIQATGGACGKSGATLPTIAGRGLGSGGSTNLYGQIGASRTAGSDGGGSPMGGSGGQGGGPSDSGPTPAVPGGAGGGSNSTVGCSNGAKGLVIVMY